MRTDDPGIFANSKICVSPFHGIQQDRDGIRGQHIIIIREHQELAAGQFHSGIPCAPLSAILLTMYKHTFIPFGESLTYFETGIRTSVINQEDLNIRTGLRKNAVYTAFQISLRVIDRYDNRNCCHIYTCFPVRSSISFLNICDSSSIFLMADALSA